MHQGRQGDKGRLRASLEPISRTFGALYRDLGIERGVAVALLRKRWRELIGDAIAAHTLPHSSHEGQLLIHVDSPEWLHELKYHSAAVAARVRPLGFSSVRFKLGTVLPAGPSAGGPRGPRTLAPEERHFIDAAAAPVTNAPLREQIKKAMAQAMASPPRIR